MATPMCDYGADPAEAWKEVRRKARKDHRCEECRGLIRRGSTYTYVSAIWDGRPNSYKMHTVCHDVNRAIGNEMCGGTYTLGGLFESIREHYDECRGDMNMDATKRMIVRGYAAVLRAQRPAKEGPDAP